MLFDDIKRTYTGPAKYQEPDFDFYNRSAQPEANRGRATVEHWYKVYQKLHSEEEASELRERFRSRDNNAHHGALTELYLHNFLIEHEAKITLHPDTGIKSTSPDFLAERSGYQSLYLEVTIISDSAEATSARRYIDAISDAVDDLSSPDFFINLHIKRIGGGESLKGKVMKRVLQQWIGTLDYVQVCRMFDEKKEGPKFTWNKQGWLVELEASPVSLEGRKVRTKESRNVGATLNQAHLVDLSSRIQNSIEGKLNKYGKLPLPLIIGVNLIGRESIFLDDDTIIAAFYGNPTITVTTNPDGSTSTTSGRTGKGALYHHGRGVKNTRLSGLIVLDKLGVWNAHIFQKKKLWLNPAARHQLSPEELEVECMVYKNEKQGFIKYESDSTNDLTK